MLQLQELLWDEGRRCCCGTDRRYLHKCGSYARGVERCSFKLTSEAKWSFMPPSSLACCLWFSSIRCTSACDSSSSARSLVDSSSNSSSPASCSPASKISVSCVRCGTQLHRSPGTRPGFGRGRTPASPSHRRKSSGGFLLELRHRVVSPRFAGYADVVAKPLRHLVPELS